MERTAQTSILRLIRPIALAASFVLAILVFCCRGDNSFMLYFNLYGAMDELIASFGIGALACCVLLIVAPTESKRARIVWVALSTVACLAGLLVALLNSPTEAVRIALVSGITLGFGTIGLIGQWCCVFAQLPQRAIPFTFALSFFFGTLLWFALQIVNSFSIACVALIIFSLCGGLLLALTIPVSKEIESAQETLSPARFAHVATGEADGSGPQAFESALTKDIAKTDGKKPVKIRPAITLLDSFTMNSNTPVSWEHAFEALGGIVMSFFILGIMYWPDAVEVAQTRALLKPLGYALAGVVVFFVSARGSVSSLASGGMDRLRRRVLICASLLAIVTVLLLPSTTAEAHEVLRLANNFALAVLMLFSFISSFLHILKHDPSPTFACAIAVLCGGVGLSLGILAFLLLGTSAYIAGAIAAAIYLVALVVFSLLDESTRTRTSEPVTTNRI